VAANIGFGLIPLVVVWGVKLFNIDNKANAISNVEIHHLISDGAINFFCLALIGSIAVDIYIDRIHFNDHFARTMAFIGGGIGIVIAFVFLVFVLTSDNQSHFGDFGHLTIWLCVIAFIYCTVGKISLLLGKKKRK